MLGRRRLQAQRQILISNPKEPELGERNENEDVVTRAPNNASRLMRLSGRAAFH
jgi:hypothetical protein